MSRHLSRACFTSAEYQVTRIQPDLKAIYFATAWVEDVAELSEADAEAATDVAACAAATAASMTLFASMELRAASISLSCLLNIGWMIFLYKTLAPAHWTEGVEHI